MPSQQQRCLDGLSSAGRGCKQNSSCTYLKLMDHPSYADCDESGRAQCHLSSVVSGDKVGRHLDGSNLNYRTPPETLLPTGQCYHASNHHQGRTFEYTAHDTPDKDCLIKYPPIFHSPSSQENTTSIIPTTWESHYIHRNVTSDDMSTKGTSSSVPTSVRNMSHDGNSTIMSPHPMIYAHDHCDGYSNCMANSHAHSSYSTHHPYIAPKNTQEAYNSYDKVPYYPQDQHPYDPYYHYMPNSNFRYREERVRHANDTMHSEYSHVIGHQQEPPYQGYTSWAGQNTMYRQQETFMSHPFNDHRSYQHHNVIAQPNHPHIRVKSPVNFPAKAVKTKKHYPGDMPRRPLTAYNFFFMEERAVVLAQIPDKVETDAMNGESDKENALANGNKSNANNIDEIISNMRQLDDGEMDALRRTVRANTERVLKIHKESERKKESHRKIHGKIAFSNLAKMIGQRWRNLRVDEKKRYEDLAYQDAARYTKHVEKYNEKLQTAAVKKARNEKK